MIRVIEREHNKHICGFVIEDELYTKYEFECPVCKKCITFFVHSPETCSSCNSKLPDVSSIKNNKDIRRYWHKLPEDTSIRILEGLSK